MLQYKLMCTSVQPIIIICFLTYYAHAKLIVKQVGKSVWKLVKIWWNLMKIGWNLIKIGCKLIKNKLNIYSLQNYFKKYVKNWYSTCSIYVHTNVKTSFHPVFLPNFAQLSRLNTG